MLKRTYILSLICFLSACATNGVGTLFLTQEEATFQKEAMRSEFPYLVAKFKESSELERQYFLINDKYYNQPLNKKVSCKLPLSTDLGGGNQYWDGNCKEGYAFGLGRDIYISKFNHVEEITNHNIVGKPTVVTGVVRDFVNRITVRYQKFHNLDGSLKFQSQVTEKLIENEAKNTALTMYTAIFADYNKYAIYSRQWDATSLGYLDRSTINGINYYHMHFNVPILGNTTDVWFVDNKEPKGILYLPENVPLKVKTINGDIIYGYKPTGQTIKKLKIVSFENYWNDIEEAFSSFDSYIEKALNSANEAANIENQYNHALSNNKLKTPKGLTNEEYFQTLDYYTDFKVKQEQTLHNIQNQFLNYARRVREQQLHAAQLEVARAQRDAANAAALANTINQSSPKTTNCFMFGNQMHCSSW